MPSFSISIILIIVIGISTVEDITAVVGGLTSTLTKSWGGHRGLQIRMKAVWVSLLHRYLMNGRDFQFLLPAVAVKMAQKWASSAWPQ